MKILVLIAVIVIIFLQYRMINSRNDTYDILQSDNPDKDKFEDIVNRKCVTVFTNILKDLEIINNLNEKEIKFMDKNNKQIFQKKLDEHLRYYNVPICLKYNFTLNVENNDFKSQINKITGYRYLHCQIKGRKKLILFNRSQDKYLYKNGNTSKIDFWNQDLKRHPLITKSKYIEIMMSPGQIIYIPYGWWMCYENLNEDENVSVVCQSESFFSYFLKN